ncbi:FKBP-type peptidyl-prolyl cis-trans isomerase [Pokkaliibacter sp. CJK22405]|uniref:FKBP-type peptidyl-prolyl cis-trans isomerase n=1 Tax=Pokkaliibacter sp. CJK22405 TaxID=3384615 RepID=UPI003984C986
MQIAKDTVVQFNYVLKDVEGNVLETSDEGSPVAYLHGHRNMMSGIEKALEGKSAGEKLTVTLAPEDAYGERKEEAEQRIPSKHLQGAKRWQPGMVAVVNTDAGQRQVTVKKVGKFMITVDLNHPYAGKTLTFDLDVQSVREAQAEEIAHGHVHGDGGHHH